MENLEMQLNDLISDAIELRSSALERELNKGNNADYNNVIERYLELENKLLASLKGTELENDFREFTDWANAYFGYTIKPMYETGFRDAIKVLKNLGVI